MKPWHLFLNDTSSVLVTSNRCHASSNRCLTSSNKKLLELKFYIVSFFVYATPAGTYLFELARHIVEPCTGVGDEHLLSYLLDCFAFTTVAGFRPFRKYL